MEAVSPAVGFFIAKPRILVGENITGYTARLTTFSTYRGQKMMMKLQGKPEHRSAWVLPSGLEKLAALLHPGLPSAEVVLREHTLYPLFRPFLPDDAAVALRSHFLGSSVPGIAASCGLLPYGLSARWNRAVCLACLDEDSKCAQLHWRTSHLVPGVVMCPVHLEPLYTYCQTCATGFRISRSASLPSTRCACGDDLVPVRPLVTVEERNAESAIAQMAAQVLTDRSFAAFGHDQILATIANRAKEYGHGGPSGVVRVRQILEHRIGKSTLDAHLVRTGANTAFRFALSGQRLPRNPIQNIILIYGLFGNLDSFKEAVDSSSRTTWDCSTYRNSSGKLIRRRLGRPHSYAKWDRMSSEELEQVRRRSRQHALDVKQANPDMARSTFKRNSSESAVSYKFLVRFDKAWLDEVFPFRSFSPGQSPRFDEKRSQIDQALASHVYRRREQLLGAAVPSRITKRRLLQGHALETGGLQLFERLYETNKAVAACVESSREWSIRRTHLLLKQAFSISRDAPFERHLELSSLSPGQLKYLQQKIQKWFEREAFI